MQISTRSLFFSPGEDFYTGAVTDRLYEYKKVLAYYSTSVLLNANFTIGAALIASMGFGIINFLFG